MLTTTLFTRTSIEKKPKRVTISPKSFCHKPKFMRMKVILWILMLHEACTYIFHKAK